MYARRRPRRATNRTLPPSFRLPTTTTTQLAHPTTQATTTAPLPIPTTDWFPSHSPSASELSGHRCGAHQMLTLVAYDITDPKRLHRVAKVCEDWGVRIQYSVFECRLEADSFESFWEELGAEINPLCDRVVAYKICTKCAREIHSAGVQEHYEKVVAYVC